MLQKINIPPIPNLSKRAFWDIEVAKLDFNKHDDFIITRVFERGTDTDKKAIINFYGPEKITSTLTNSGSLMPIARESAKQLLHLSDQDFACYKSKQQARNFSKY